MKHPLPVLFSLVLVLSLAACGAVPAPAPSAPPGSDVPAEGTEVSTPADTSESPVPGADQARRAAFAKVLRTAHDQQVLSDGTPLEGGSIEAIEGNLFALHDVDGDGQEELILLWQNATMAGQMEVVYGYDGAAGQVRQELREFPGVIFYTGGAAEAPWSHNQGWAGAFWPYTLYRWQPETDTYETMGSVDAWDSTLVSCGFPRGVDTDGDGVIYFLLTDNWSFTAHRDPESGEEYWYYEQPPVDGAEYLRWREDVVGAEDFLELSFQSLTAENIADVLEVPYEPLLTTLTPNAAG